MDYNRKAVISWWLYDWANSAFILTVVAGFFPIFFKSYWCFSADPTVSTARLGMGNAFAGLFVAILSPFLGAFADACSAKKRFLAFFMLLGTFSTTGLFFVPKGEWLAALLFFLIASVGFNSANILYDALLVDVAEKNKMDWVSSVGYSYGYLGCGLLFAFNALMVSRPYIFGLSEQVQAVRLSFATAAVWWFIFSIPLLLFVKERKQQAGLDISNLTKVCMGRLITTIKVIGQRKELLVFLLAYWFYIDGVHTFVLMAVDFGMAIGLKQNSLIIALLVVQFVGFPSTLLCGGLSRRFGTASMIVAGIVIYITVCGAGALLLRSSTDYIILAGITGMAQGGIQALSRSWFGKLVPQDRSAEYFGFFNIVNRFAVILGPAIVGVVVVSAKRSGMSSVLSSRIGMSSISVLFIIGALLLIYAERLRKEKANDRQR